MKTHSIEKLKFHYHSLDLRLLAVDVMHIPSAGGWIITATHKTESGERDAFTLGEGGKITNYIDMAHAADVLADLGICSFSVFQPVKEAV